MNRRAAVIIALYGLIAILTIPVFPNFASPNEVTRWAEVAAVLDYRQLDVTPLLSIVGAGNEDFVEVDGRVLSNKAPGAALLGVPGYLLARGLSSGPPARDDLRLSLTMMRWFAATLPLLLLAWLFSTAVGKMGGDAATCTGALLFGTPLFAYGMLYFSHALAAAALFPAWWLLFAADGGRAAHRQALGETDSSNPEAARRAESPGAPRPSWRDYAAGALLGLAVFSEYPILVAVAALLAVLAASSRWKSLMRVCTGATPFALALAGYNIVAFGHMTGMPFGHDRLAAFRDLAGHGVYGVQFPTLGGLTGLLFHPARGLFVFSPIALAGLYALPAAWRRLSRPAFASLLCIPISMLLLYAGYPNWNGGWTVGSRYLVPILPFVIFPLAFSRVRAWTLVLLGASSIAVVLPSLTFPFVPLDFPFPWGTLSVPLIREGLVAPDLLHNFSHPLAMAAPFLLALIALGVIAGDGRRCTAAVLGVGLWLFAGVEIGRALSSRSPVPQMERVYIEDVYFERRGTLDRAVATGRATTRLLRRRSIETQYGPGSWRF